MYRVPREVGGVNGKLKSQRGRLSGADSEVGLHSLQPARRIHWVPLMQYILYIHMSNTTLLAQVYRLGSQIVLNFGQPWPSCVSGASGTASCSPAQGRCFYGVRCVLLVCLASGWGSHRAFLGVFGMYFLQHPVYSSRIAAPLQLETCICAMLEASPCQ